MNERIGLTLIAASVTAVVLAGGAPPTTDAGRADTAGASTLAQLGPRGGPPGPPPGPPPAQPGPLPAGLGGPCQLGALHCLPPTITVLRPPAAASPAGPPPATPTATATARAPVSEAPATATVRAPVSEAPAAASPVPAGEAAPPAIQLRFDSRLYDGVAGSYCWGPAAPPDAPPPAPGLCVDRVAPTFDSVLVWPAGAPVEFVVQGPAPRELTLAVATRPTDPLVLQTTLPPGTTATWTPVVPPGAYVLAVHARWPEGEATYYFPIGITAADEPPVPAAVATPQAGAEPRSAPAPGPTLPNGAPSSSPADRPAADSATATPSPAPTTGVRSAPTPTVPRPTWTVPTPVRR